MPLIVEEHLPAKKILQEENVFIMGKERASTQDIRPIKLAIVNLMPNKEETEIQLFRVLSNTPLQINIDLVRTESYKSKHTEEKYLEKFYKDFSQIKNDKYDGMIITGAPVEKLEFEEVLYWKELEEIFEFARTNVYSTMFICWAAQAGLYYYYDIPKYTLNEKIFGVFEYELMGNSPLTKGFDDVYYFPQSRYSHTREEDVREIKDLQIISTHPDSGPNIIASSDHRFVFVTGHGEYSRDTLYKEYIRDLNIGLNPNKPQNYFRNDNEEDGIVMRWRSYGNLLFTNWLNYCVYQETPYDLGKLEGKKTIKFGGSSLSDSKQFKKVREIILSDENRNLIVVSAPGKRFDGDEKVTDLLISFHEANDGQKDELLKNIKERYYTIVDDLDLKKDILDKMEKVFTEMEKPLQLDYLLSRGEYLSALIMAEYLDFEFLDAKDIIFFDQKGKIDYKRSTEKIKEQIVDGKKFVIPGFYGCDHEGNIKCFDRGGSDITGSIVASAMRAQVYENWTDVDGVMSEDPRENPEAKPIDELSYGDFLKISLSGDQIYHLDAIDPVMQCNIPINIRNTNNPSFGGTIITNLDDKKKSKK
ncbi:MAG TPA: homoserine O-succinyltransferase [Natronincola sp.]|nr:homoserine O-succinyltransferase [Natronincola sp.]